MSQRNEQSLRTARVVGAIVAAGVVVTAFGALGGVGFAGNASSAAQYQYGKVTICHHAGPHAKRVTITIARSALAAHLRHGDTTGACSPAGARAGQGEPAREQPAKAAAKEQKAAERAAPPGRDENATAGERGRPAAQPAAPPGQEKENNRGGHEDNGHGKGKGNG